jgi:hypothetical protein
MKNRISKIKGVLLLGLAVVALIGALQISFLAVIENARSRILLERRRETAKSLADMGSQYYSLEGRKFNTGSPASMYPSMKRTVEKIGNNGSISRYSFSSPSLIRTGNFILQYDYSGNSVIRITSTGSFEGIRFEKPLNP